MIPSLLLASALSAAPTASASTAPDDARHGWPTPDRPGAVQPVRTWDLTHLHLDVTLDLDAGTVSGTAVHRIEPLPRPASRLRLDQIGLDISEVLVDGQPSTFEVGPDWLDIPVSPGTAHEVSVSYRAAPQLGMFFRRPGQDAATYREIWTQGEGEDHRHWFPSWDHPTDRFTFSTDVTVDDDLIVVANGGLTGKEDAGGDRTTWSFELDREIVNYLVVIAAGEYQELPHEGARIPISSFVDARLPTSVGIGMDRAVPMLEWFDEALGTPYAYDQYRHITVQSFLYGGMENTTATILADRLLADDPWDDPRRMESVVAHELAHQWFGDLLTCYGWRELWLNEGFATYWTNRWMEHAWGEAYVATRWRRNLASARGQEHPMALRAWSARPGDPDNHNVYNRGATVLRMLEVHLGREVFDAGIRRYVASNVDRLVETDDLRRALEDVSGEHLGWLFDQWVYRPGSPTFTVTHRFVPGQGNAPGRVEVVLDQGGDGTIWIAPVTVELGTDSGVRRYTTWVDDRQTRLVVETEAAPRWVFADPDQGVIATWKQEQSPDQWHAALQDSPSWGVRLEALHELGAGDPDALVEAATAWVRDAELDPRVRREGASALGASVSEAATEALLELAEVDEAEVRSAVVEALGKQARTDRVIDRLQRALRDDDARVRAAALDALARQDANAAVSRARRLLREDEPVTARALSVLGKHGSPKDARRLIQALDTTRSRWHRTSASSALWALVDRFPDEDDLRAEASRAVEPLLDSSDARIRRHAIRVLGGFGDEQAARTLQAWAATSRVASHREAARDAARDIRGRERPETPPPTPDDLERIRERVDRLQERLDSLEQRP